MSWSRTGTQRPGCKHCIGCYGLTHCGETADTMMMWPAGLQSPTVYFSLRERQLAYNIRAAAAQGGAAWRADSVAGGAPADLLLRRGAPQLALRLPCTAGYGVTYGERAVFVRSIDQPLSRPAAAQQPPARKAASAPALAPARAASAAATPACTPPRLGTPPQAAETVRAWRAARAPAPTPPAATTATPGHFILPGGRSSHAVVIPMSLDRPAAFASSCASSAGSSSPSSEGSSSGASPMSVSLPGASPRPPTAAASPLLSLLHRVRDMLSPAALVASY